MNRFKHVDILRAVAVFLVLGRHMTPCPETAGRVIRRIYSIWHRGGWVGVDLFFVLSGFLVSGLLFREHEKHGRLDLKRFLIRRGFKIYPPFWLLIGVTGLLALPPHQYVSWRIYASELLFVQNYFPGMWNHTWSLAVEEHFYLLLALGAFLVSRRGAADPFRFTPAAFIVVALVCLSFRISLGGTPFNYLTHLIPTHLRMDSLFFGVLLSYLYHRHPAAFLSHARRFRFAFLAAGIAMLLPAFFRPLEPGHLIQIYGLSLFFVASGCLLVAALGFQGSGNRFSDGIAYVGSHSYSIYLWHMPVTAWATLALAKLQPQGPNWFIYCALYLGGSIILGIAMALLVEFPILRLRDRLFPSRGRALSTDESRSIEPSSR